MNPLPQVTGFVLIFGYFRDGGHHDSGHIDPLESVPFHVFLQHAGQCQSPPNHSLFHGLTIVHLYFHVPYIGLSAL